MCRVSMRNARSYGILLLLIALIVGGLSACGGQSESAEAARPVLVVHPGGGAQAALSAYAGEIRAREESPLSFRVGGNLIRRNVDAGTQVKQGEPLMMIHYNDESKLETALNYFKDAYRLAPKRPTPPPLVVERVA